MRAQPPDDAGPTTLLQMREAETQWHHWRTPESDQDRSLSSAARAWIKSLPDDVRPYDLAARHPRVVNRIALCWSDAGLLEHLFNELLVDRRGGRKGFAHGVAEDLMRLRSFHARQCARREPGMSTPQMHDEAPADTLGFQRTSF